MLLCLWIPILLSHTEVDNVNNISCLSAWSADQEVVWLDISIDQIPLMDSLDS